MHTKTLISVIIPVYNTSKYLRKCLNSVINQTIQEIEIIIVNDGSTDNSLSICKEYSVLDNRVIIIDKENAGLEKARKTGIEKAKGIYVAHLDSDDWLSKKGLESLYKEAIKFDADIVVGKFKRVFDRFGLIKKPSLIDDVLSNKIILQGEFRADFYKNFFGINIFPVSMWGRLYKKSFIDSIYITELGYNLGEDLNYNIQVFPEAKKIFFSNEYVYFYRYGGMTSRYNEKIIIAALKMFELKKRMITKYDYLGIKKYIFFELKNFLKTYIEMLIVYKPFSKEKSFEIIKNLINNKNFTETINFYKKNGSNNDIFAESLVNLDITKMFAIIQEKIHKERYVRNAKKILSSILN